MKIFRYKYLKQVYLPFGDWYPWLDLVGPLSSSEDEDPDIWVGTFGGGGGQSKVLQFYLSFVCEFYSNLLTNLRGF